ncbi:hypothetical protein BX600DRAFT_477922 [Xylariales sp. PMI_506]|nr:hypothetical protein BX600DRAFT_477922 [Xylariales sp. PMI_506]
MFVLGSTIPSELVPRSGKGAEVNANSAPYVHTSLEDVPHCLDVLASADLASGELQQTPCYINATEAGAEISAVERRAADYTVGPYCLNGGVVPGLIDATTLCDSLSSTYVTLPPAYSTTTCACETYVVGTAAFAFCNCDYCNSANAYAALGGICTSIKNNCISPGYAYGYIEQYTPNAYWILYGNGASDPSPVYTACT